MARDDGGAVVMAFVLGAITGAAVALLMTPATGEDVRRTLADKARDARERAEGAARQGKEFVDRSRGTVTSAFERGREAYEQARGGTGTTPAGGEAL
jgi:gas vesicle protein